MKLSYFSCAWLKTGVWLINFVKEILPSVLDYEVITWNDNSAAIGIVNKLASFPRRLATWPLNVTTFTSRSRVEFSKFSGRTLKNFKQTKGFHPENFRQKLKLYQGAISLKLLENRK